MASTQPTQDDLLVPGGSLSSGSSNYKVLSFLGQGTFGKVAKCTRMEDMKTVAIKMMKNQESYVLQAKEEVAALSQLKVLDSDKCNLVKWYQAFTDRGHICLEFEHLDRSLHDFMKERYFRPLPLKEIRPIVQQLASALSHLKAVGIIHADLKLENVMLVDHVREPYRVKVIDFGLACNVSTAKVGSYIQTRPYRSPEVILGLPFTEAIDMWSLGCLAAYLYLGTLLYPGINEYDMMRFIVETQGQPPDHLLTLGYMVCSFFQRDYSSTTSLWKLKTPLQFLLDTGIQPVDNRRLKFSSLDDLLHIWVNNTENSADKVAEMTDLLMFVDMLKGMLELDASKRFTPSQVLEHQFTSMCHMVSMYPLSSHVRSCFEIMDICQSKTCKTPTPDSGKAVCGSSQQPSSGTTTPIQRNLPPPPPAEMSYLSQPHCINPHPCTSTQTTSSVMSGIKRKADDEDGHISETSHQSKRIKSGLHRKSPVAKDVGHHQKNSDHYERSHDGRKKFRKCYAGPSTSSSRSYTQSCLSPRVKRKMAHDDDDSEYYKRSDRERKRSRKDYAGPTTSKSSSYTQSYLSPRVKRKRARDDDDSDYYERSDRERKKVRKSYAGRSTCSSYDYTHTPYVPPDRSSRPAEHQRHSAHPSGSTQEESRTQSGHDVQHRKRTSHHRSDNDRKRYTVRFQVDRRREPFINERRTTKQCHYQGPPDQGRNSS